jgi:hypothetical protein
MTEASVDVFRFAATGDYSPSPPVRLTITDGLIVGDRYAGFLYPVVDGAGEPVGNLVACRKLAIGEVVEAAEVPPRDPPVTFNGHPYRYMEQR